MLRRIAKRYIGIDYGTHHRLYPLETETFPQNIKSRSLKVHQFYCYKYSFMEWVSRNMFCPVYMFSKAEI